MKSPMMLLRKRHCHSRFPPFEISEGGQFCRYPAFLLTAISSNYLAALPAEMSAAGLPSSHKQKRPDQPSKTVKQHRKKPNTT